MSVTPPHLTGKGSGSAGSSSSASSSQNVISSTMRTSELNRAPTLSPRWMRLIASPNSGATERTVIRGLCAGGSGMVSVTTISVIGTSAMRSSAGPEKTPWVAQE